MSSTTTRALRARLSATMARAAKGEEIIITRRGRPYVRLLPVHALKIKDRRYPLRGSVLRIARDFDAPLTGPWKALRGGPSKASRG